MVTASPPTTAAPAPELRPSHGCLILVMVGSAVVLLQLVAIGIGLAAHGVHFAQMSDPATYERLLADPWLVFGSALLTQLAFLASVPVAVQLSRRPAGEILALRRGGPLALPLAVVGMLGFGIVGDLLIALIRQVVTVNDSVLFELATILNGMSLGPQFLVVVGISVVPGICEEVLFRGVLFTAFLRRWGPTATVIATAVLFGLIHLDPLQTPAAIVMGLYLGWIRLRTHSLWPAAAAHAANNLMASLLAVAGLSGLPGPLVVWAIWGCVVGLVSGMMLRPADEQ